MGCPAAVTNVRSAALTSSIEITQVWMGFESTGPVDSLPRTVAVFVTHTEAGAVPVMVMGKVSPAASCPSAQETVAPTTEQPGVDVAALVTPAGMASLT